MGDRRGEEDFFDNDFGEVSVNALHDLERQAITLSQRPRERHSTRQSDAYSNAQRQNGAEQTLHMDFTEDDTPHPPSSDYGFDDEDVIDLDDPSLAFTSHAPPIKSGGTVAKFSNGDEGYQAHLARPSDDQRSQLNDAKTEQLHARLAELEQDRIRLSKALDDAQIDATTKAGAIANLRSRNERSIKDYEIRIAELQKQHSEDAAKLKAEIRAARANQENLKTSNRFLEHDLLEERERGKRQKGPESNITRSGNRRPAVSTTPKRIHNHSFRDGFDDDEIINLSPSKREKNKSPHKTGSKRKRSAQDSPASQIADTLPAFDSPHRINDPTGNGVDGNGALALSRLRLKDDHISVIQEILDHAGRTTGLRTIEVFTRYHLPESPERTFASYFLSHIATLKQSDSEPTTVAIRQICLDLWERCIRSKLWAPLPVILDLFEDILYREHISQQVVGFERLLKLATRTCVEVAEPRIKPLEGVPNMAPTTNKTGSAEVSPKSDLDEGIDDLRIMSILRAVAVSASYKSDRTHAFWQHFEFNFALLMLNNRQPLQLIRLSLEMLGVSVLEDSFGPRHTEPGAQARQESDLLDRISNLLSDPLKGHLDQDSPIREEDLQVRLDVLHTIRSISSVDYGSKALVKHRFVIGRLVRFLCHTLTSLYNILPLGLEVDSDERPKRPRRHELTTACINLTTRILYDMLQEHEFDPAEKFDAVHGGYQKGLIALSRLAFSERGLLEAGIEDTVADAAHEILDVVLTPEDGEAVLAAMESPRAPHSGRQAFPTGDEMEEDH